MGHKQRCERVADKQRNSNEANLQNNEEDTENIDEAEEITNSIGEKILHSESIKTKTKMKCKKKGYRKRNVDLCNQLDSETTTKENDDVTSVDAQDTNDGSDSVESEDSNTSKVKNLSKNCKRKRFRKRNEEMCSEFELSQQLADNVEVSKPELDNSNEDLTVILSNNEDMEEETESSEAAQHKSISDRKDERIKREAIKEIMRSMLTKTTTKKEREPKPNCAK